jgi:hypothetical protein
LLVAVAAGLENRQLTQAAAVVALEVLGLALHFL